MSNIERLSERVIGRYLAHLDARDEGGRGTLMTPRDVPLNGLGGATRGGLDRAVVAVPDPAAQAEPFSRGPSLGAIENALYPSMNP